MKRLVVLWWITGASCTVLQSNEDVYRASKSVLPTSFVYHLPYEKGSSHWIAQGSHSLFSHHDIFAVDIKMKQGTKILAARSGVVMYVKETYTEGGLAKKYASRGNGIRIQHDDGTYAHYWHLQFNGALVDVGDTVLQGQVIGLSGNTGFSAFPHLHFEVTAEPRKKKTSFPVLFQTEKGAKFLQPLRRYKAI